LLTRTSVGLHMRAAALDFATSRMLGVRANRVIGSAVLVSGFLAAVVAVLLTVQFPLVTPSFALRDTIVVLAGVVLGGLNRPIAATLGGFTIALVSVVIVVGLYIFIGNTGVLSFGHISFVALGAWTAGVLSVPTGEKPAFMPSLFGFLRHTTVGNVPSLLLAAVAGGVFALVVGL